LAGSRAGAETTSVFITRPQTIHERPTARETVEMLKSEMIVNPELSQAERDALEVRTQANEPTASRVSVHDLTRVSALHRLMRQSPVLRWMRRMLLRIQGMVPREPLQLKREEPLRSFQLARLRREFQLQEKFVKNLVVPSMVIVLGVMMLSFIMNVIP
ncbi:MAG: hypothetical protein KDD44_06025, partial [Bdellovibrionales bacterium]|nr:hypothetical protein [Bdellovibrionales bacterium]